MKYINDWEKIKKRFCMLWNCELMDRCCISVTAPKHGRDNRIPPAPENPVDRLKYWTDAEWIAERYRKSFENTYFGGEAFPVIPIFLGAAGCAGFFKNARFEFSDSTVWFFPYINDYNKDPIELDAESLMYMKTFEIARYLADESKGDYIIGMPDLSGTADALSHMRGPENFLMDMIDDPDSVKKALKIIQDVRLKTSRQVYDIVRDNNDGGSSIGWLRTWGPGYHDQMQCDLSVMISQETFKKFIMPELEEQVSSIGIPLYHFDGIEQTRHLDLLLSLEKLAGIQWTCVEGQPSPLYFIPVLKKIQNAGKALILRVKPEEVETLMEQLSSNGLFLIVEASSEEEAMEIEKKAVKLTHE